MISLDKMLERLGNARNFKREFNLKIQKLREIAAGVEPGRQLRLDLPEASTNYLLVNLTLKVASIVSTLRSAKVLFVNAQPGLDQWFADEVKNSAISDFTDMLKDRFATGLGVIGLGGDENGVFLQRIDPLDIWWSPEYHYRNPAWTIRRIIYNDELVYEYWDGDWHCFFNETEILHTESNLLNFLPVRFIDNFSMPRIAFPISDVELAYPQQQLLNEIRMAVLEGARRGTGFFEASELDVDPLEMDKIKEPGEVVIFSKSGNAIRPHITPPIAAEWLQMESIAKSDLDAQSGVSEYLRGNMPIANNIKFATQILAALGSQNLRIQADWVPLKEMIEWCARAWMIAACVNKESRVINDIIIDAGKLEPATISVKIEEEAANALSVSEVGINPDAIGSVFNGL